MNKSKHIQDLHNEIYAPIKQKWIEYRLSNLDQAWGEKYQLIKDQSWPECNTMQEFENLPTYIQEECKNVHNFTPLSWKQCVIDDINYVIKDPLNGIDKTYAQKVLENKKDILFEKDIVDLACHTGSYSFASIEAGANSVVGVDIRDEALTMAKLWKKQYQIPDAQLEFLKLDIHNYNAVTDICRNKHTVLVPGIMYHVHDHFQLLESVALAGVENILIETLEEKNILHLADPLIWWKTEPAFIPLAGWYNNQNNVLAGHPNLSWFKLAFDNLGFVHCLTEYNTMSTSLHHVDEFALIRSVHVFKRNPPG